MLDRRNFMTSAVAAAASPALAAGGLPTAQPEDLPDAWESELREIDNYLRVLRKCRAAIDECETNPGMTDEARRHIQYLFSTTVNQCSRMIHILGQHSVWKADKLVMEKWSAAYPEAAAARARSGYRSPIPGTPAAALANL